MAEYNPDPSWKRVDEDVIDADVDAALDVTPDVTPGTNEDQPANPTVK